MHSHLWKGYPLPTLIRIGATTQIIRMLDEGCDIEQRDEFGLTPLMRSIKAHGYRNDLIQIFLDRGANINARDSDGDTVLLLAARHSSHTIVRQILIKNAHIDHANSNGMTALMIASERGDLSVVTELLGMGESFNSDDQSEVKLFLDLNNDLINSTLAKIWVTRDKFSDEELAHKILQYNLGKCIGINTWESDVSAQNFNGRTALMLSCENNHTAIIDLLLKKGADVRQVDRFHNTALLIASRASTSCHTFLKLIHSGSVVDHADETGGTALMYAARKGNLDLVSILIENGASVDQQDTYGHTALMEVSKMGYVLVVQKLLESKASTSLTTTDGKTALMIASGSNYVEVVRMLLGYGADVNHVCEANLTAIKIAATGGYLPIVEVLIHWNARSDQDTVDSTRLNGHHLVADILQAHLVK